jgi:hypothetical protein
MGNKRQCCRVLFVNYIFIHIKYLYLPFSDRYFISAAYALVCLCTEHPTSHIIRSMLQWPDSSILLFLGDRLEAVGNVST